MTKDLVAQPLVLLLWFAMVWLDPQGTYQSAVMVGASLLPLLLLVMNTPSPWVLWWGALPLDRLRWLRGEFLRRYALEAGLLVIFWALVALVKAGPQGWTGYWSQHAGAIVSGVLLIPWMTVRGLEGHGGSRFVPSAWVLGPLFGGVVAISLLGTLWEWTPDPGVAAAIVAAGALSLTGAWFRARHLLFQGRAG